MTTKLQDSAIKVVKDNAFKSGRGMEPIKVLRARASVALGSFTEEATSQTFTVGTIPADSILLGVAYKVHELADDGASIASATLDSGTSANADLYLDAVDVLTGSGSTGFVRGDPATVGDGTVSGGMPQQLAAALALELTVTADVNVDTLTAGDVEVFYYYFSPSDPDA